MSLLHRLDRLDARVLGGLAGVFGVPLTFTPTSETARELWEALPLEGQRGLLRAASLAAEMDEPRDALIVSELQADIAEWRMRGFAVGLALGILIAVVVMVVGDMSWMLVVGPIAGPGLVVVWGVRRLRRAQQANTHTARQAGLG